ncbi:hypothetical protein CPB83DRAFT_864479 [Crepidotus variabilis]|uniref:Uncharacterized protein n=1 Tax=Crepidotus variabilis TaxID=179855 RepID=A0A9P6E4J0_9AGAR|nr:hypothetical protein CPB83DRAFT_864479 [Crepidotus variabilis]
MPCPGIGREPKRSFSSEELDSAFEILKGELNRWVYSKGEASLSSSPSGRFWSSGASSFVFFCRWRYAVGIEMMLSVIQAVPSSESRSRPTTPSRGAVSSIFCSSLLSSAGVCTAFLTFAKASASLFSIPLKGVEANEMASAKSSPFMPRSNPPNQSRLDFDFRVRLFV